MLKENMFKNILFAIALFVFIVTSINYVRVSVFCKDCGSEDNCYLGSGFDSGYQDCYIDVSGNCTVTGWGDCNARPNTETFN